MRPPNRFAPVLLVLLLSIVVAVLYAPGLRGAYYGDDLMFVRPLHGDLLGPFLHANAETGWYRPIEAMVLGTIQDRFGLDTTPIHLLALALHVVVALLVARLALRIGLGRDAAIASAFTFAISQACASAVLGNDTLSQLFATTFGMSAVLLFAGSRGAAPGLGRALLGVLCVLLAMLSKEAGIGWAAAAGLAAVTSAHARDGRVSRALLPVALIAITVAGYLLLRSTVGARPAAIGPGRYDLDPGLGIVKRSVMLLGVTILPLSTVVVAEAWSRTSYLLLGIAAVLELAIAGWLMIGAARRPRIALLLAAGALLALGPVIAIRHVSELYAFTAMPCAAIAIGAVVTAGLRGASGAKRWIVIAAIAMVSLLHGFAVHHKATLAAANGERATALLAALTPEIAATPAGGTIVLVQAQGLPPGYSVYRQVGFEPVEFAESFLRARTGRNDFFVRVMDPGQARLLVGRRDVRALTLMGNDLVPFFPASP